MTYYGGREISDEDLEKALVVGMSPHERRRFEKKRGYTFKHLTKSNNPIDAEESNIGDKPPVSVQNPSNGEDEDSLLTDMKVASEEQDYVDILTAEDAELSTQHQSPNIRESSAAGCADTDDAASDIRSISVSHNEASNPLEDKDTSQKRESKMSLLGHGPHGKQVVEYLLKEHGDDGIREFCQRWRHVFVEALHPRFLPAGWDVKHRYGTPSLEVVYAN